MLYFIIFILGGIFGLSIYSVVNASKTAEERERAEHAIKMAEYYKNKCKELQERSENAKSEAIKEFAERLKAKSDSRFDYSELVFEISEGNIDNLVKEIVGED